MTKPTSLSLLLALLCVAGCTVTTAGFTRLNDPPHEMTRRHPNEVQVFSSGPPRWPHVDVGIVTVEEGEVGPDSPRELIRMLRELAAERGCDALVLSPPGSKSQSPSFSRHTHSYRVYSGTCVVRASDDRREVASDDE